MFMLVFSVLSIDMFMIVFRVLSIDVYDSV